MTKYDCGVFVLGEVRFRGTQLSKKKRVQLPKKVS